MTKDSQSSLLDLGTTTVSAFNIIKNKEEKGKNAFLGIDDTLENTPNTAAYVYVYTPQDEQKHKYFHSLSIDKQIEDFMGTAELRCAFDSDLMEYWEPIRNYCIIYGSNKGENNVKILFVGRVRGVKQEGYELVIQFQDPYWKFKQLVSQSYANDNVLNKDGYTIMRLIFETLKIDSYVISESAKNRLKQVGFDQDGNLTLNKEQIEEMPDLLERLKESDPSKFVNKDTISNKLKESEVGNVQDINYTLQYKDQTSNMKKISSEGAATIGYSAGSNIYSTKYGGSSNNDNSGESSISGSAAPDDLCSSSNNSQIQNAMKSIWSYNHGYSNDYSSAHKTITNYARNAPSSYSSKVASCLSTLAKYSNRSDKNNAAQLIKNDANKIISQSGMSRNTANIAANIVNSAINK